MQCPTCRRPTDRLKSIVSQGGILNGCSNCLTSGLTQGTELAAKNHRDWQKREYAKDLVQPNEEGYAKAYGADNAREHGWSDDNIRKYS